MRIIWGTASSTRLAADGTLDAAALATFFADYVDRWNRCDLEGYYSLYAAELVFRDGSVVLRGVDALRDRYEAELRDHPDLTMECLRLFVDVESQSMAAENIEGGTGIELRGALFLSLNPEGRISEIAEYLAAPIETEIEGRTEPSQAELLPGRRSWRLPFNCERP